MVAVPGAGAPGATRRTAPPARRLPRGAPDEDRPPRRGGRRGRGKDRRSSRPLGLPVAIAPTPRRPGSAPQDSGSRLVRDVHRLEDSPVDAAALRGGRPGAPALRAGAPVPEPNPKTPDPAAGPADGDRHHLTPPGPAGPLDSGTPKRLGTAYGRPARASVPSRTGQEKTENKTDGNRGKPQQIRPNLIKSRRK